MTRLSLLLLWFIAGSVTCIEQLPVRGIFGVRVAIQSNSEMTTFACFLNNGRTLTHKRILTRDEFVHFATGDWPSIYNPDRRNLFEEHSLKCGIMTDSFSFKKICYCIPVDSLWKLRFSTYPYRQSSEMGWSSNLFRPSLKQEKFLFDTYGVANIDGDFFLDSAMWRLLSDVQDSIWIHHYQSLK